MTNTTPVVLWKANVPATGTMSTRPSAAIPARLPRLEFCGDWDIETRYPCLGFGRDWNGFATPVVIRPVLTALMASTGGDEIWDVQTWTVDYDASGIATITCNDPDSDVESFTIAPDMWGMYDLGPMGWTFYDIRDIDNDGVDAVHHDGRMTFTSDEINAAIASSTDASL